MRDIKTFKDMAKHAGAKFQVLLVRLDTGDVDDDPYQGINEAQGALATLTALLAGDDLSLLTPTGWAERIAQQKADAEKALQDAKSEFESLEFAKFHVRGFTPQETLELRDVINVERPEPPIKVREVGWEDRPPLEQRGQVQAPRLRDEHYADENDPVYLREVKEWEEENRKAQKRVIAYSLMKCVQGCDLSDEEIESVLGEKPHAREPLNEFRLRLDQVGSILTNAMAMPVWMAIQEKVTVLTGISPERVDFTSLASRLPNLEAGRRVL